MSKIFSLDSSESLTKIFDKNTLEFLASGGGFNYGSPYGSTSKLKS